jgi:ABC-2 type transport system permease protein
VGDLRLVLIQAGYGLRTLARNPRVIVFTIAFPVVLLVLFDAIFADGDATTILASGEQISTDAYFTAGIIAYAIMMSSFSTLAIGLTTQRESGQLKRLRGTPLPSWTFIAAQVLRAVVLVAGMVIVLLLIGHFAFDVPIPGSRMVGFVIYVVLGTAAFAALGIALTVVTPTAEAASTIAPFGSVMLSFISGVFIPVETLPDWLEEIGRVFPLAHLSEGLQETLGASGGGTGLSGPNVAVIAAWGLAGVLVAARRFRWEPQAARG